MYGRSDYVVCFCLYKIFFTFFRHKRADFFKYRATCIGNVGQTILVEGSNCPEKNIWTEIVKETLTTTQSSSTVMMSWMHLRVTGTASLVMSRG